MINWAEYKEFNDWIKKTTEEGTPTAEKVHQAYTECMQDTLDEFLLNETSKLKPYSCLYGKLWLNHKKATGLEKMYIDYFSQITSLLAGVYNVDDCDIEMLDETSEVVDMMCSMLKLYKAKIEGETNE